MEDDEQLCWADAEDEDEPIPELQQEYSHLKAQQRADWQQQQEERHLSRARHSAATGPGRGRAAAPRRAAGEPAQAQCRPRQRRRYTGNPADAAGSHSFGAVDHSVDEGYMGAAGGPQEPDAHDDALLAFIAQLAADAAAAAEHEEPGSGSEGEEASEWSQRSARAEAAWREQSPFLGAAVLQAAAAPDPLQFCSVCNTEQDCTVRCWSCSPAAGCVLLCSACDQARHQHLHLHKRQQYEDRCWKEMPRADPEEGYFLCRPSECRDCHGTDIGPAAVKTQTMDYITRDGVVKAKRAAFQCVNPSCGKHVWQRPQDFIAMGAWPASLDDDHCRTIVAQDVLQLYLSLKLSSPALSLSAFCKALSQAAWRSSLQQPLRAISTSAFRRAATEFSNCQLDLRLGVQLLDDLVCPACSGGNCACHIDGNMKLFVWQRSRELWRAPHSQLFFADDGDVQLTIQAVDWARGEGRPGSANPSERENRTCNGVWAAAGDGQQRRQSKQAVTGRVVAVDARHGMPRKGVSLVGSGERYGYALHLLAYYLKDCTQLHIDIMCKWGPWLRKAVESLSDAPPTDAPPEVAARIAELRQLVADAGNYQTLRTVLSHAHGNLHALNCQVLWQPGWTEQCAKTLGEEAEQFFAYWAQFAHTTRNQSLAGAVDQLTHAAVHFGRDKVRGQAKQLVKRFLKFQELLPVAESKLACQLLLLTSTPAQERPALVCRMRQELRELATSEVSTARDGNKKLLEQYSAAVSLREAHDLRAAITSSMAALGLQTQRLAAVRIMAGLTDPRVAALHDITNKLLDSAAASSDAAEEAGNTIRDQFAPALDASIVRLQNVMEGLCHDLKKQERKREATAALPKERQRHNKKCKELVVALAQRVQQYNTLVLEYNRGVPPGSVSNGVGLRSTTNLDDVRGQQFCWVNEYSLQQGSALRIYGVARAMEVCEADNEVARVREELALLPQEMRAYVSYHRGLLQRLQQLQLALAGESTAEQLQAAGYTALDGSGRYQPTVQNMELSGSLLSGAMVFVGLALAEVRQRLADAAKRLQSVGVAVGQLGGESGRSGEAAGADSEDGDRPPPVASDDGDG